MLKTIHHQVFYPHPPELVWDYLTNPELLSQWVMPNDIKPLVGHQFKFTTKPILSLNVDGIFNCEVIEVIHLKKLSYSWKGGPGDGSITLNSLVEWTLKAKDNGTELTLAHSGFTEIANLDIYNGMNDGWFKNMHKIETLIKSNSGAKTNF